MGLREHCTNQGIAFGRAISLICGDHQVVVDVIRKKLEMAVVVGRKMHRICGDLLVEEREGLKGSMGY